MTTAALSQPARTGINIAGTFELFPTSLLPPVATRPMTLTYVPTRPDPTTQRTTNADTTTHVRRELLSLCEAESLY